MDALTAQSIRRLCGRLEAMRAGGSIPALMAEFRVGAPEEECRPLSGFEGALPSGSVRHLESDTSRVVRAIWLAADAPRVATFRAACADAARVALPTLRQAGFAVGLGTTHEDNAWLWSIFEMAALQLPGVPLRLEGGDIYRVGVGGITINETAVCHAAADPSGYPLAPLVLTAGPTRYWRLLDAIEASLAVLDIAQTWPQSEANAATTTALPCEPADEQSPTPRGEVAAERLRQLWADPEGRKKILAAGSAERIGQLIGRGKTAVVTAGRIWDEEIKPKLQAMRTVERYHREEERLDG
jgi:hypothetical protein